MYGKNRVGLVSEDGLGMKVFWALVGGLMVAGGALVVVRSGGMGGGGDSAGARGSGALPVNSSSAVNVTKAGTTTAAAAEEEKTLPARSELPVPSTASNSPTASSSSVAASSLTPPTAPAAAAAVVGGGEEKSAEVKGEKKDAGEQAAEMARKAMEKSLDEMLGTAGTAGLDGVGLEGAVGVVRPEVKKDELAGGGGGGNAELRDTVVTRGDGSKLIDGRFVVRGKGTEAEPYRVPWEMLASVQETYSPRKGLKKIPERIKFLDGKWVKLSGFIAFPITSNDPKGLLVMLNQWDGCCIGVPPTPYDSVEVYLGERATASQRASAQGSVYGRLKVDPIDDDGWVIGVYVMQGARLVTEE